MQGSVLQLMVDADPIVKLVLLILVGFSVVSWAIIFQKGYQFVMGTQASHAFVKAYPEHTTLKSLAAIASSLPQSPLANVVTAISTDTESSRHKESFRRLLKRAVAHEIEQCYAYLSFLATTGSTTPFIGLFGTVWGIMNAFRGIGATGSASLAVVAPGIAEALITTAAGLAAAIPSVVAYNYFLSRARDVSADLEDFSEELSELFSKKTHEA